MTENEQSQPTQLVMARPKKSMGIALILTILFGPLGLLYASISGGLIMIFGSLFTGAIIASDIASALADVEFTEAVDIIGMLAWLISIVLCVLAVKNHNRNL